MVTVVNNYTDDLGDLKITKTFIGTDDVDEKDLNALAFEVTGPNGYSQTVYYIQFVNGEYTIKNLPVGEYAVTETNADGLISGYSLLNVTT